MKLLGHVYPDSGGPHGYAASSYVGRAVLQMHHFNSPDDAPTPESAMYSIMLAVPPRMHRVVLEQRPMMRATAVLVPWAGSGIGLLAVSAAADAVLAVVDIAGRADLGDLQAAARRGKVSAGIASDADPAVTPLVAVAGFADALSDARSLRRLAARELAEAMADVRALLRGPAARALLGTSAARLDTLSVNICPLA